MSGYFVLSDGRTVHPTNGYVIGRGANCDLVLDDTKASRRHARLVVEAGVVEIEDLGSSNGTYLNGRKVDKRMVRAGDEVRIGKSVLTFREGAPADAAPAGGGGGPSASAAGGGGAAAVFDDDDELFGSSAPAADPVAQPAPKPAPEPAPKPATGSPAGKPATEPIREPAPQPEPKPEPQPKPQPKPEPKPKPEPPARPKNVVEFADEIVEVRTPAPASKPATAPARRDDEDTLVQTRSKVLQYSKHAASKNVLGDDVGQMGGGMRALVFVAIVAGMAGIAWLVMNAVG